MPLAVIEAAAEERLVVFAGAGISTESPTVLPNTFYDDIREELHVDAAEEVSFPDLMSRYCAQPDGRIRLLRRIKERLDYVNAFPQLLKLAARFHHELSPIPQIAEIVTTNWDPYFEHYAAATPFVYPQDFSFWQVPGRKVFKIHGSVSSYGSIIATAEDYARCYSDIFSGVVGANLRMLLATKTVVFVGYSLRDSDLVQTYEAIKGQMGNVLPQAYIVTVDAESAPRFEAMGLLPVVTDATFFLEVLRAALVDRGAVLPANHFEGVVAERRRVAIAHRDLGKMDINKQPLLLYTFSYQDGLLHGLARVAARESTGEYFRPGYLLNIIRHYEAVLKEKLRDRNYFDVAYVEGYLEALYFLAQPPRERKGWISRYFLPGNDEVIQTRRDFLRALKRSTPPKRQVAYAESKVGRMPPGMVPQHLPIL